MTKRIGIKNEVFWTDKVPPSIMEYGIYLLALFLFTDKGESFRSLGLYIPPVALTVRAYLVRRWPFDWNNLLLFSIIILTILPSSHIEKNYNKDEDSLARAMENPISDNELRKQVSTNGRKWIIDNFIWDIK